MTQVLQTFLDKNVEVAMIKTLDIVRLVVETDIKITSLSAFDDYETTDLSSNEKPRTAGALRASIRTSLPYLVGPQVYGFDVLVGDNKISTFTGIYYAENMEFNIVDTIGPFSKDGFEYQSDHAFVWPTLNVNMPKYTQLVQTNFIAEMNALMGV